MDMDINVKKRLNNDEGLKEVCHFQKKDQGKRKRLITDVITEIDSRKRNWCFIPIQPNFGTKTVSICFNDSNTGFDPTMLLNSLKETYELFQNVKGIELPSVLEATTLQNTDKKTPALELNFSHFKSLQMLNHALFLISLAEKETGVESSDSYTPQYPFLVQMYNTQGDAFDTQRIICFLKTVREWVIASIKFCLELNFLKTPVFNRVKKQESEHQLILANSIHKILNVIFCYHEGDVVAFSSFLNPESIGMVILYHTLFMDSIDRIHWKLIEELDEFFKTVDIDDEPSSSVIYEIRSRHLALASNLQKLRSLPKDDHGCIILNQDSSSFEVDYGINPLDFIIQIYSFVCDPQLEVSIAMALLCYLQSSFVKPFKIKSMEDFANGLPTPFNKRFSKKQEQKIRIEVELATGISSISKQQVENFKSSLKSSSEKFFENELVEEVLKQKKSHCKYITSFDPFEYAKAIKVQSDSKKMSIFYSQDLCYKLDALQMLPFYHFIMELEKTAIMKSKVCPQILLLKEFEDPTIRFPFNLNSFKKIIYMDEIFLCRY